MQRILPCFSVFKYLYFYNDIFKNIFQETRKSGDFPRHFTNETIALGFFEQTIHVEQEVKFVEDFI